VRTLSPRVLRSALHKHGADRTTVSLCLHADLSGSKQDMVGAFDPSSGVAMLEQRVPDGLSSRATVVFAPSGVYALVSGAATSASSRWVELPIPPPVAPRDSGQAPAAGSHSASVASPASTGPATSTATSEKAISRYEVLLLDPAVLLDTPNVAQPPVHELGREDVGQVATRVYSFDANLGALAGIGGPDAPLFELAASLFATSRFRGRVWLSPSGSVARFAAIATAPTSGPLAGGLHGTASFRLTTGCQGAPTQVILPRASQVTPLTSSSPAPAG